MRALLLCLIFPLAGLAVAAPAYTVKPLSQLAVYPKFNAALQVVAENESRIAAEVTARIDAMPAGLGQSVKKGDILVRLDARQYRLTLDQALSQVELLKNRYRLAELQFEQAKKLQESNFVSAQALEQRRTELAVTGSELKIARHAVEQARLSLNNTLLRAPFAGTVKERLMSEGELATPGQPILTLVEGARNELRARIPNSDIDQLKAAQDLQFTQANQRYPVKIVRIAPVVDARAQTRDVILKAEAKLLPGSAGELTWSGTKPHLPAAYLQQRDRKLGAWIEQEGKPVFKLLPHAQVGRPALVDWPRDTRVIDEGRFTLTGTPAAPAK